VNLVNPRSSTHIWLVSSASEGNEELNLGAHLEEGGTRFRLYIAHDQTVAVRLVDARGTPVVLERTR
jgi:hypothetical protein